MEPKDVHFIMDKGGVEHVVNIRMQLDKRRSTR